MEFAAAILRKCAHEMAIVGAFYKPLFSNNC